jgi:predicted Rdx family selenoprotein
MAAPESAQEELEKYGETEVPLPRIAIKFCVRCNWNLRAAYVCLPFSWQSLSSIPSNVLEFVYKTDPVSLFHGSHFLTPSLQHQYAQELLSTFSTSLGEVSLIPATGGTFTITLLHRPSHLPPPTTSSGQPDLSTSLSPSSFPDTRYLPRPPVTEIVLW